jgi:hypothetical protein
MALSGIQLSAGVLVGVNKSLDAKYGPYPDVATAKSNIGSTLRYLGLTIGIITGGAVEEYWWESGTADGDLVIKEGDYITDLTGEATATGPGIATVTLSTPAVTSKLLSGVNIAGGTVVDTDTILEGFGKLQNQINGLIGGTVYQGVWDAFTNTPTLTSGVGTNGHYYIVDVYGTTNLDGIAEWHVGDWAIFHDNVWQKVDNTDAVVTVNGYTGAVSLVSSDIPEGLSNLYFTSLRATQAISLNTTGTSGAATYNSATGEFNIPQYQSVITNPVTGTGSINTIPKFIGTSDLTDSSISDNGATVTINGNISTDGVINPIANSAVSFGTDISVNGGGDFNGAVTINGSLTATSLIKSGGTSSEFLKADGSVDSNEYSTKSLSINTQISSYILVLTDANKMVEMNVATANNLTIPLDSSVAFPIGTQIIVSQLGAGQTTFVAALGVTIRQRQTFTKTAGQYALATLIKRNTDEWILGGDLA